MKIDRYHEPREVITPQEYGKMKNIKLYHVSEIGGHTTMRL